MGSDFPLVSVIVAVKNGGIFIDQAIQSVFLQRYDPIQFLVIDGKSTDNTVQVVKKYKSIDIIIQDQLGLATARNCGINAARGSLIAFLDYDDIWLPGKLKTQVGYLLEHPNIKATLTKMCVSVSQHTTYMNLESNVDREIRVGYTPGTLVARKEVFQEIGLFDQQFSIGCDSDWFARAIDGELPMAILPQVFLHKRLHGNNLSMQKDLYKQETLRYLKNSIYRKQKNTQKNYKR